MEEEIFYRRRLPHFQPKGETFFVTFRLAGSLPKDVVLALRAEKQAIERRFSQVSDKQRREKLLSESARRYFGRFDEFLDKAWTGPIWLAQQNIARLVADSIHDRDAKEFDLFAFCIMPNHVHIVFALGQMLEGGVVGRASARQDDERTEARPLRRFGRVRSTFSRYPVTSILRRIKGSTAYEANRLLGRDGAFWQHESYDHVIRDDRELERIVRYVIENPVKAHLCRNWRDWKCTYLKEGLIEA